MKINEFVEFVYRKKFQKGRIFNFSKKYLDIILNTGYIFSFLRKNISNLKIITPSKPFVVELKKIEKIKENKNKIIIINTGGTIASVTSLSGGVNVSNMTFSEYLRNYLNPNLLKNIQFEEINIFSIFSENLDFDYLKKLIILIQNLILKNNILGIIITHGTDTLAFSSAFCSLIFDNFTPIPICFVGAQKSIDRPNTDAILNLKVAVKFILELKIPLVFVVMYGNFKKEIFYIHRGISIKKMHTSRRDSFKSINKNIFGYFTNNKFYILNKNYLKNIIKKKIQEIDISFSKDIGLIYIHPFLNENEFKKVLKKKGIILIGTGIGNIPIKFFQYLKNSNNIFYLISNCLEGKLNLKIYSVGKDLEKLNIIPSLNPTLESSFAKLSIGMGRYDNIKNIKNFLKKDLCDDFEIEKI